MIKQTLIMAFNWNCVTYACRQISGAGEINCKNSGEYGVCCPGKIIGLICDNRFLLSGWRQKAIL